MWLLTQVAKVSQHTHDGHVKKLKLLQDVALVASCISWNLPLTMTVILKPYYEQLFTPLFSKLIVCVWLILRTLDLLMGLAAKHITALTSPDSHK